ncbi:MAG: transglutaminase-like putative cysteine protease [Psychroserpens sp.]|jgi:transglutaminase-like putative cysteine protease
MNKKRLSILNILCFFLILSSCNTITCMKSKVEFEHSKEETIPTPDTLKKDVQPETVEIDEILPSDEIKLIKKELAKKEYLPVKGRLIQIEGLVVKEVAELTIKLKTSSSPIEQILAMKNYVQSNWHYIFDPKSNTDEWRSAEATISLKYNNKYSGDCDDFAILMASFARQVSLESRVIGAYKNDGSGHAYAEFLVPKRDPSNQLLNGKDYRKDFKGKWISLDWFKGSEHKSYKNNLKIIIDE